MDNGGLAGIIIWGVCTIGCAALFFGIGIWAERSKKPVHFWSGIPVESEKVRDIPGYNHANAVMWKCYSLPYFLSGILGCLSCFCEWMMTVALILLIAACVPGIFFLIRRYMRIENEFIFR